ncbi:MAG: hypothetical protein GY913_11645 [Proteobacteria bacterium]|nr:hypothetical protein [Pseudomonadota bacterium]MCP4917567.1 hypothetical protein [Pseudomonadota bacterium]
MKKVLPLYIVLALTLLGFFLWSARLPPFDGHPEPEPVTFEELSVDHDAVRVDGTAHYALRVTQDRPGRFGRPDRVWYVFPLFAPRDTSGTIIDVMVASPFEPENMLSFEDVTLEGWALPKGSAMSPRLEEAFREAGYTFQDDYFVIEVFPLDEE